MIPATTETEVKLDLHPAVSLPSLEGVVEGTTTEVRPPQQLTATYHDTADLRLVRAGVTLRHRPEDGTDPWQVELPVGRGSEGIARLEVAVPGDAGEPPQQALDLVAAVARGAALHPVVRLVTDRRTTSVLAADGALLAKVADDEVRAWRDDRLITVFREVEVESADAGVRRALVERLVAAGAQRTGDAPKLVRALGPDATRPDDLALPPAPDPDPAVPLKAVVSRALLVDLVRMVRHDPGTRLGTDIEALHQMRVATRRLRTTLRTYRPVLDEVWADELREALRALAADLGAVRDLDVLLQRIRADVAELPPEDAEAGHRVVAAVEDQRAAARAQLLERMAGPDHTALLDRVLEAAREPRCPDPTAAAGPALAPLVTRAWRKVERAAADGEHLHDARLRIKRLRYAAEAVAPAFGRPAVRLADAAGDAQAVLGAHQDAEVAMAAYRRLVEDADPGSAYVLGVLSERERHRRDDAQRRWPDAWEALRRPKLRRFLAG